MDRNSSDLTTRYANLSATAEEPSVGQAAPQPPAGQIVIGADDLKVISELKAKGNLEAIGEYVSNLIP